MARNFTILLVEDDNLACEEFKAYTEELDDISLVGTTNNSDHAIDLVKDYLPDAVILDLELHCGAGNGLLFLQQLKRLTLPTYPFILITTNNTSLVTYDHARHLGADFIMSKHQADYSVKGTIDFLRMMRSTIQSRTQAYPSQGTPESPDERNKRIVRRISSELDRIGISPKAVGYLYLIDAIQILVKQPTQNLCSIIGQKYGKTEASVERAMQNAINKAWRTSDIEDLLSNYTAKIHSEKGTPTITEFIYFYAHKIKNEY